MAMRKPVICYIDPAYRKYRPDLPIVSADPLTIETELERFILSKELRMNTGEKGVEYVKTYHDVEVVVDELLELYGFTIKSNKHGSTIKNSKTW